MARGKGWRRGVPRAAVGAMLAMLLAACGFLLPESEERTESPWKDYQAAKAAYDRVVPYLTTEDELKELGFDPFTSSNITILSYLEVMAKFMPNDAVRLNDLDDGVRACVEARARCRAYEAAPSDLHSERVGTAVLDVLNFKRQTVKTGWSFTATILIKDGLVMYKLWRGTPKIRAHERKVNPLGPLQDPADLVIQRVP